MKAGPILVEIGFSIHRYHKQFTLIPSSHCPYVRFEEVILVGRFLLNSLFAIPGESILGSGNDPGIVASLFG
jgi:hypothetical protein